MRPKFWETVLLKKRPPEVESASIDLNEVRRGVDKAASDMRTAMHDFLDDLERRGRLKRHEDGNDAE